MQIHEPDLKNITLNKDKTYRATLFWRKPGYSQVSLKHYYISPQKKHCYFFDDQSKTKLRGCFPLHWFKDFQEVSNIIEETDSQETVNTPIEDLNSPSLEKELDTDFQQLTLF